MKTRTKSISIIAACLCPLFIACMWDFDTIQMERRKFPTALELITGKFLRHSEAYYQWRIQDRTPKLSATPSPELFDDLAVAHEKLGNHDQAIELMREKQLAFPDLYETHANLGTFYIHKGEYEKGIEEITKAIEINPDAHFGREIYQKSLVEYVLSKKAESKKEAAATLETLSPLASPPLAIGKVETRLPLDRNPPPEHYSKSGFSEHLNVSATEGDGKKAVKGILGMMRFGNYDSPILLEALGDLLRTTNDSNRIAARAYLKASYEVKDKNSSRAYREKAAACIKHQQRAGDDLSFSELSEEFRAEIKEADDWFESITKDENLWVSQGLDLDQEFGKKHYDAPKLSNGPRTFSLLLLAVFAVPTVLLLTWWTRRRKKLSAPIRTDIGF